MKISRILFALLICSTLLNACKQDNTQPQVQLVKDGDMETMPWRDWGSFYGYSLNINPNKYTADYSNEAASSGKYSIKVKCDTVKNDTTFYVLNQHFLGVTIPVGAKLTLKAKVKTVNLQGMGISLALQGDNVSQAKSTFYTSTEGKTTITGTKDFTEYSLTLDSFPANTDYVYLFLIYLHKTTGTAYFDDVSLVVN